jgi:hypothetical protein
MAAIASKEEFTAETLSKSIEGTYPPRYTKMVNKRIGGNCAKFSRLGYIEKTGRVAESTRPNHAQGLIHIWKAKEFSLKSDAKALPATFTPAAKTKGRDSGVTPLTK